jgi:hypothetical protein
MLTILSCKRTVCDVTVRDPTTGKYASCSPLVDTGAQYSALSSAALIGAPNGSPGPGVTMHFGGMSLSTMFYPNAVVEVIAEAYGQGASTARTVTQNGTGVNAHYQNGKFPPPYHEFDGILGMDLLDALSVDPVKDASGARAYLAIRV